MWIRTLADADCRTILAAQRRAVLACAKDNFPYVVPVHYAYSESHIYVFSLPGRKIEFMRANPRACLLVAVNDPGRDWSSVIVEGRFEELPDRVGHKRERDRAWSLLSRHANWWEPGGLKPANASGGERLPQIFFRISIDRLSGRHADEN